MSKVTTVAIVCGFAFLAVAATSNTVKSPTVESTLDKVTPRDLSSRRPSSICPAVDYLQNQNVCSLSGASATVEYIEISPPTTSSTTR